KRQARKLSGRRLQRLPCDASALPTRSWQQCFGCARNRRHSLLEPRYPSMEGNSPGSNRRACIVQIRRWTRISSNRGEAHSQAAFAFVLIFTLLCFPDSDLGANDV